jgi:hypothetical protein
MPIYRTNINQVRCHGFTSFFLQREFKRNGIVMEQRLLKKIKGSYDTMWRDRYLHALQFRDDFGTLPNQAAVDLKEEDKLRKYPWNLENYKHLMLLMVFQGMKLYFLRASKEVS